MPTDFCAQLGEARRILTWLVGTSDDIPLDDDQRGSFIGARDDYARTDAEIRQARDQAVRSLANFDLPDRVAWAQAAAPWQWPSAWANACRMRGIRDLLDRVLGDRPAAPIADCSVGLPTCYDLSLEEAAASDVASQGRPGGLPVDLAKYPPPQYGEAIQAAIAWLRGETAEPPAGTG